jgi:hypothetical protein
MYEPAVAAPVRRMTDSINIRKPKRFILAFVLIITLSLNLCDHMDALSYKNLYRFNLVTSFRSGTSPRSSHKIQESSREKVLRLKIKENTCQEIRFLHFQEAGYYF